MKRHQQLVEVPDESLCQIIKFWIGRTLQKFVFVHKAINHRCCFAEGGFYISIIDGTVESPHKTIIHIHLFFRVVQLKYWRPICVARIFDIHKLTINEYSVIFDEQPRRQIVFCYYIYSQIKKKRVHQSFIVKIRKCFPQFR